MPRSRSRSKSRERRRERSRSRERRRERSRSRERRRNDRRRSPDRQAPVRRSPDRRELRVEERGHERRNRSRSRERGHGGSDRGGGERREREPRRDGSREREQRAMPPPPPRAPGPCFKCGEEGHMARDCPNAPPGGGGGGGRGPFFKCGEEGHIARDCPNPDAGGGFGGRGRRRGGEGGEENMAWGKPGEQDEEEVPDKEVEPEFGLSGALAAETNKVNGVVLVHQEPPEARKPTARWRLYVFKGGQQQPDPLYIHRQSSYLFGRERRVADIPTDHPSCSKQHAVLQYRLTEKEGKDGMMKAAVRPYLMDLGSTNGTFLNAERLEPERYYEMLEQDIVKFGNSSREYVLLKEK